MTNKELNQKHLNAIDTCINTWDDNVKILGTITASQKCSNISIEFAIECLNEVIKQYKVNNLNVLTDKTLRFTTIDNVVLNKIKQLKNETNDPSNIPTSNK